MSTAWEAPWPLAMRSSGELVHCRRGTVPRPPPPGSRSGAPPRLQTEPRPLRVRSGQAEGIICPLGSHALRLRLFVSTSGYRISGKRDLRDEPCLQTCWLLSHSAAMHIWSKQPETICFHTVKGMCLTSCVLTGRGGWEWKLFVD